MPTTELSPADPRNYWGFAKQTVKGTAVVPSYFAAYIDPVDFAHNPNIREIREAGGGHVIARQVKDFLAPSAGWGLAARPDIAGAMFAYFLGVAPAPTGAGPYVHTITPGVNAVWLTGERNLADDTIERIRDMLITDLVFDLRKRDQGPDLMLVATAQGLAEIIEDTATVESYEADRPWKRSDCTWTVDGASAINVERCTITLRWQMDLAALADAVTRATLVKLHLHGEIELVQMFNTTAERTAYLTTHYGATTDGSEPTETVFNGALIVAATYGAGAGVRAISVNMPEVDWGEAELTPNNPNASEAVRLTRRGKIVGNPGGSPITVTATNNKATAYI